MTRYMITASIDGVDIDFQTIVKAEQEPNYYEVYDLCMEHGCPMFYVDKLED